MGSGNFSYLVHTYIRTYVGGAPLSPHARTQKLGFTPLPPPIVTAPYDDFDHLRAREGVPYAQGRGSLSKKLGGTY